MNRFVLKCLAIISMTVDHVGAVFYPDQIVLRLIGRLAFPIFAFLIAEGLFYTKNIKAYTLRLTAFALVTEVIFDLCFYDTPIYLGHQNVLFTFAIAGWVKIILDAPKISTKNMRWVLIFGGAVLAGLLKTDYGAYGVLLVFAFYEGKKNLTIGQFKHPLVIGALVLSLYSFLSGIYGLFMMLSLAPLALYNGKKGYGLRYLFYGFYPGHLGLLWLIRYLTQSG